MKLLLYALAFLTSAATATAEDASVIPVEVRQPRFTIQGGEPKLMTISMGSGVVFESGKTLDGEQAYALLTAAHVVMDSVTNLLDGTYSPKPYPSNAQYEVNVEKEWCPATFVAYSTQGDLALLTFKSDKHIPLSCLAGKRALKRSGLTANGFINGNDQHVMYGKCRGEADYPAQCVSPNCDIFFGPRESFVGGLSGGAVFDEDGNLAGIISCRLGLKAGYGMYTHVGELRRFLAVGWDGKYRSPITPPVQLENRAEPRSLRDEPESEPTLAE